MIQPKHLPLLALALVLPLAGCEGYASPFDSATVLARPLAPAGVQVATLDSRIARVSWAPSAADSFSVEVATSSGGPWDRVALMAAGTTSAIVTGTGETFVSVVAVNAVGPSDRSATLAVHFEPPSAVSPPYQFLTASGFGTLAEAQGYYASIGAVPTLTLAQWKQSRLGTGDSFSSTYQNAGDLGFWREMTCSVNITAGQGGCVVSNWPEFAAVGEPGHANLGTVAMDVSPEGYTRFYIFAPDGSLSPSANLDSEGEKFLPRLCTNCHGGRGLTGDLGSVFREFEPSFLVPPDTRSREDLEVDWYQLNRIAHDANAALRTEAAGARRGTDAAVAQLNAYVDSMYEQTDPPVALAIDDPAHFPQSWEEPGDPLVEAARLGVWTRLTAPYCAGCHRATALDFSAYSNFAGLLTEDHGTPLLKRYIYEDRDDPARATRPWMPQAQRMSFALRQDLRINVALDAWLRDPP